MFGWLYFSWSAKDYLCLSFASYKTATTTKVVILLALQLFVLLKKTLGSNLQLVVLLVHRLEGSLEVFHLFVVHPLDIGDLPGLVSLESLHLMNQTGILLLQLTHTVNVACNGKNASFLRQFLFHITSDWAIAEQFTTSF